MNRTWWRRAASGSISLMWLGAVVGLATSRQPWQWALAGFWCGCAFLASLIEWIDRRG